MGLKNIFKRKREDHKEVDFSKLVIGTTISGRTSDFDNEDIDKLVELYRDNKKMMG